MRSVPGNIQAAKHLRLSRPCFPKVPPKPWKPFVNSQNNIVIDDLANQLDEMSTVSEEGSVTPREVSASSSSSIKTSDRDLLFTGNGTIDSPFTEVTINRGVFDKAACIKELEHVADSYGFELVELVLLPPIATTTHCTSGPSDCPHPSYHPDRRTLGPEYCADRTFFKKFYRDDDVDMSNATHVQNKDAIEKDIKRLTDKGKSRVLG